MPPATHHHAAPPPSASPLVAPRRLAYSCAAPWSGRNPTGGERRGGRLATPHEQPTGVKPGCLVAGGLFLAGALGAIVVVALLPLLDDGRIDLGRVDDYPPGSVVYRATDGFYVVRAADGELVALSDLDPHNAPAWRGCRVTFRPDLAPAAATGGVPEMGVFFDACTGSMYDILGRGLSGDGLDLRRIRIERSGDSLSVSPDAVEE